MVYIAKIVNSWLKLEWLEWFPYIDHQFRVRSGHDRNSFHFILDMGRVGAVFRLGRLVVLTTQFFC